MGSRVSSWVRQSRHRAKSYGCVNRLETKDVNELLDTFEEKCAYCGAESTTLDHAFQLSNKAPNVIANCLPSCHACKDKKKNFDMLEFYQAGHIPEPVFLELLKAMLERDGGDELRTYLQGITGIGI